MGRGSYRKKFMKYASVSVLGTVGISCYILADTFFISKGLGMEGLTALNLAIPVYNFIYGIGLMIGMGGGTRFSISKSTGDHRKTDEIFMNSLYPGLIFGVLAAVVGVFFADSLAVLLGADAQTKVMTALYLRWLLLFAPAFILNNILLCFVRNDSSPALSSAAMLIGSFANILLDYIFIFPMKMGMFGAVFATGLSPMISMTVMLLHWRKPEKLLHITCVPFCWKAIRRNIVLGFPSLITQAATGIAMIVFNMLILDLKGNVGVAAYGVTANLSLVVSAVYTGIAQGIQPLLSGSYGKGEHRQIWMGMHYANLTIGILSVLIYAFIFLFADGITGVFNGAHNRQMQEISVMGLRLYFLSAVFVGFNTVLAVYFTSVERALPAHILSLLRGLILLVPLAFVLAGLLGMTGIWLTCPLTEALAAVAGFIIYKKRKDGFENYETGGEKCTAGH